MVDDGFWSEDGTLNRDLNENGEPFFTDFFDYEDWQAAYSCREDPYFDFCCKYWFYRTFVEGIYIDKDTVGVSHWGS